LGITSQQSDGTSVVECLKVWPAPHDPTAVIGEASDLLRQYGLHEATGDRYAANFVADAFRKNGIAYRPAEHDKSQVFLDFAGLLNSGKVRLLDHPQLLRELRALERKRGQTRDRVDHPVGQHDDAAVAVALSVALAARILLASVATVRADVRWQRKVWGIGTREDVRDPACAELERVLQLAADGWQLGRLLR
jgi:hypothetical protein